MSDYEIGACNECRHYCTQSDDPTKGYCRRYPPLVADGKWPVVCYDEWCGEFSIADNEKLEWMKERWERWHNEEATKKEADT